jgi:hypothetical protein
MAKSAEVLLRDVDAKIANREDELANLRDFRTRLIQFAMQNGAHRNGSAPRRAYHRKPHDKRAPEAVPRLRARNGKPGIGQAVVQFIQANPGLPKKEAILRLIDMKLTDRPNPKKIFQTRVGQLLESKALREEGDREKLFVNE